MISSIIQALFHYIFFYFFLILPNMKEQEKKQQRIYEMLNAETKPKIFFKIIGFFMASIKPRTKPS